MTQPNNIAPAVSPEPDEELIREAFARMGRTFRGEIWENARRFRLVGPAYKSMPKEQDGYFWLESARHLEGPLRALNDPAVREVGIIGATQVLKSLAGNLWVPTVMEHDPDDMLILFENDDKAAEFALRRLMPTIKQHPQLSARLEEETESRHDVTGTKIKSASMSLLCGGLNDSNVSSFPYRYVWISESWQHGSDGMLDKARKRTDRFPDSKKILIESQAGLEGEDLHRWTLTAHEVPLTWACPCCGGRQTWEFSQLRPESFQKREVTSDEWQVTSGERMEPIAGTYAGMWFPPAEETATDGSVLKRTIQERARAARWECYWCGTRLPDTPAIREAIARTYEQDYKITVNGVRISPARVVFVLPKEANTGNTFEASVLSYLTAKEAERLGNKLPLRDWWMSERAKFYSDSLSQAKAPVISASYNIEGMIPDEVCRVMMVDVQQDAGLTAVAGKSTLGTFWYVARAIDKAGNQFQLARGFAESVAEWQAVQDKLGITNENVGVDGGNWLHDILDLAAKNIRPYQRRIRRHGKWREETIWHTWTVLIGSDTRSWRHKDGRWYAWSEVKHYTRNTEIKGQQVNVRIPCFLWSNLEIKDALYSLRVGGEGKPKFVSLAAGQLPEHVQRKEQGDLTYEQQMDAEYRTEKRGKPYWERARKDNHYGDCECGCEVLFGLGGYLGVAAAPEQEVTSG